MKETAYSSASVTSSALSRKTGHVLLVGCGEIGSRHLQAVADLASIDTIEVVDPRPESLKLGQERLSELPATRSKSIHWLNALDKVLQKPNFCILATQAEGRVALVRKIVETFGIRRFLLEKMVTQSLAEYEQLMAMSRDQKLSIWVNCKTRAYPFHLKARERFRPEEPIQFTVMAGNHGLMTNGIHNVDLFAFYDRSEKLSSGGSSIDSVLHPSKRGPALYDLSGTLLATSNKGSSFILSFAKDHMGPPTMVVASRRYRFVLDQWKEWAYESDEDSGSSWRPAPFEGNLMISQMTKAFVSDILATGKCLLPTLEESYAANAYLLSELQPHFSRLLGRSIDRCPVT